MSTRRLYILKQTCSFPLQVCLIMYNLLVNTRCHWLKFVKSLLFCFRDILNVILVVSYVYHMSISWGRLYHFKYFKGCLPQILLGPFLNILTHLYLFVCVCFVYFRYVWVCISLTLRVNYNNYCIFHYAVLIKN